MSKYVQIKNDNYIMWLPEVQKPQAKITKKLRSELFKARIETIDSKDSAVDFTKIATGILYTLAEVPVRQELHSALAASRKKNIEFDEDMREIILRVRDLSNYMQSRNAHTKMMSLFESLNKAIQEYS